MSEAKHRYQEVRPEQSQQGVESIRSAQVRTTSRRESMRESINPESNLPLKNQGPRSTRNLSALESQHVRRPISRSRSPVPSRRDSAQGSRNGSVRSIRSRSIQRSYKSTIEPLNNNDGGAIGSSSNSKAIPLDQKQEYAIYSSYRKDIDLLNRQKDILRERSTELKRSQKLIEQTIQSNVKDNKYREIERIR